MAKQQEEDLDLDTSDLGDLDDLDLDDEEFDLLDEVVEDDSEAWMPKEKGDGIQGVCIKRGEVKSDYSDQLVPTCTIQNKAGKWRIIAYGKVLRDEMTTYDPQPGDLVAFKYFGKKAVKSGPNAGKNSYHHYQMLVRKKGATKKS